MKKRDKRFLNDNHEEFGSVSWRVTTEGDGGLFNRSVLAELRIADCYKVVSLDFDCDKASHIDKRLSKLDSLIDSLQDMREALVEAKEDVVSSRRFYY